MKVLISGGAGFIGSTIASALLDRGDEPIVLDNLATGQRAFTEGRLFYEGDMADDALMDQVFSDHPDIKVAIHCGAFIDVNESVIEPQKYYETNVIKTLRFVESLRRNGCHRLIFSSSASVYVDGGDFEITEENLFGPTSPYGNTKMICERMLQDIAQASQLRVISFRYFNPLGADPLMRSGDHTQNPSHVIGKLIKASFEQLPFTITGTDYPTHDGTGIRDYIHVWDLAAAHAMAATKFDEVVSDETPYLPINLGTGKPLSVRELVQIFNEVSPRKVAVLEGLRRPGDAVGGYASCTRAFEILGWRAELDIARAIEDALRWIAIRPSRLTS